MRLSKQQEKQRADHVDALKKAEEAVRGKFAELTAKLADLTGPVNDAIRSYNSALSDAEGFARETAEAFRETCDEKSDRWRESEAGQSADSFTQEWEAFEASELEEIEIVEPELSEEPCHAEALGSLPAESE